MDNCKKPKVIMVTAFEAFGGQSLNPTQLILERLPDTIAGCSISKLLLPVEFIRSQELAFAEYDALSPDAVVMLGQAGGRSAITPETTGRNVMNACSAGKPMPDNAGYAPDHDPLVENGADELYATLPVDEIVAAVSAAGVPCEKSGDAGVYVCNTMLYGMLAHNRGEVPTGFIHVPLIREQAVEDKPFMELDDIFRGISAAIEAVGQSLQRFA